jgi:hypothetical protein
LNSTAKGVSDTGAARKLRRFIFDLKPQPFDRKVFAQDITGTPLRQQEGNLKRREAGLAYQRNGQLDGGVMGSMRNWVLGAAVLAGTLGLGAAKAQAAEFRVYARGPVAYVPPCPGAGYEWAAGYNANGYWIPGRWNFVGVRVGGPAVRFGYGRGPGFDRHFDRGWDRDRGHEGFRR